MTRARLAAALFVCGALSCATSAAFAQDTGSLAAASAGAPVRYAQAPATPPAPPPAQPAAPPAGAAVPTVPEPVGSVATVQGVATVTRNGARATPLKATDPIMSGDIIETGVNAALGITFDDDTTFNMGASARMVVDQYLYDPQGTKNTGVFSFTRGTFAFVAGQVARTGQMQMATPTATLGIRGTTGVVDVPANAASATPGQVNIKLYQDADGKTGRIEVFAPGAGGARLGILTRAATGFGIRPGAVGGVRFAAVPITISPAQVARDRGFVRQAVSAQGIGRQFIQQRRQNLPGGLPNRTPGTVPGRLPGSTPGVPNRVPGTTPGGPQRQGLPQNQQRLPGAQPTRTQGPTLPGRTRTPGTLPGATPGQPAALPRPGGAARIQGLPGGAPRVQRLPGVRAPGGPKLPAVPGVKKPAKRGNGQNQPH